MVYHGKVFMSYGMVWPPASIELFPDGIELYSENIAFYHDGLPLYCVGIPWHNTMTVLPTAWYSCDAGPLHCGDQHTSLNKGWALAWPTMEYKHLIYLRCLCGMGQLFQDGCWWDSPPCDTNTLLTKGVCVKWAGPYKMMAHRVIQTHYFLKIFVWDRAAHTSWQALEWPTMQHGHHCGYGCSFPMGWPSTTCMTMDWPAHLVQTPSATRVLVGIVWAPYNGSSTSWYTHICDAIHQPTASTSHMRLPCRSITYIPFKTNIQNYDTILLSSAIIIYSHFFFITDITPHECPLWVVDVHPIQIPNS